MSTTEIVVTILAAVLGGTFLGSIVQGMWQRKKLGADYADVIARSATTLLTPLADRVHELEDALEVERRRVVELREGLEAARIALRRAMGEVTALRNELAATRRENEPRREA